MPDIFKDKVAIGEGTFGKVYKAKIENDGRLYALKKIKMENADNGFPITSIREVKVLKLCAHPNIVNLVDVVRGRGNSVYLVFEFVENDLHKLIYSKENPIVFNKMQLKYILRQMLEGCKYMHSKGIIHRDIKGGNILINN